MSSADRIAAFLTDRTVLVTGATGFLGQPLVEKILWTAPEVERVWVLIRPKRQFGGEVLSPKERLRSELFESSVFDRLRFRHGEGFADFLRRKLVAVGGDISEPGLGIDPDERERLLREVDVVINSAAVVSFDAPLDQALELNGLGAGRVASFAAECDDAILIHVSTAYVCGATDAPVPETLHHTGDPDAAEPFPPRRFSDVDRDIEEIRRRIARAREESESAEVRRELVAALVERRRRRGAGRQAPRRETVENLRRKWLENRLVEVGMEWARERGWNDTYTYTKALGEQIVSRHRDEVPTAIVRPAIIESSLHEPSPGWLDGLRMADPLIVAIGKGRLRSLPLDPDVVLDLVPADMVVNAMMAAIPKLALEREPAIYQVATGSRNPATMRRLHDLIVRYFRANPMLDRDGDPVEVKPLRFPGRTRFRIEHKAKDLPLRIAESLLERLEEWGGASSTARRWRRRVSATRAALQKLFYYGELYGPYLNLDCRFQVDRTLALYRWLNDEERRRYDFDVERLNWRHYLHVHIAGVKKYILKLERAGTLEIDDVALAEETGAETIGELFERSAARYPEKIALRARENGRGGTWRSYTYGELREAAREAGERLRGLGLEKGDRVVLVSENRPEWGVAYLGATLSGLVVVPLDAQTWHREVWATARFTEAKAILASRAVFEAFTEEELDENESAGEPIALLEVDRHLAGFGLDSHPRSTDPAIGTAGPPPEVESEDVASIVFTTGTAVDPRGAVHTHANFLANLFGVGRYLSADEEDRFLSVLPLYHTLEFTCGFLMPLRAGATVTYAPSLKPKVLLETMRETATTIMLGVPTLFLLLREDIERRVLRSRKSPLRSSLMETSKQISRSWQRAFNRNIGRQLFSRVHEELGGSIRFFVSGGSKLGPELFEDYKALGVPIYEGYGLTETAPVLTVNPLYRSRRGSAGKPLPGIELRLYRTNRDGVGEIIVRTPSLMKGYWKNPRATERAVVDGWFHTGDLGWVDADGYLYITGRIKDVIVTGAGKNVYPMDLEEIYRSLPPIAEVCVVGIKSGLTEDVHAAVVPDPENLDEPGDREGVREAVQRAVRELARELPSYHRLQKIHLWDEPLPRDDEGRPDREAVRREIERRVGGTPPSSARAPAGDEEADLVAEIARLSGTPAEEIDADRDLYEDLGLDSLQAIELLLFLEHRLGVSLDDETAERLRTVGEVLDAVRGRSGRDRGAGVRDGTDAGVPAIPSARPWEERSSLDRAMLGSFGASMRAIYELWFDLEVRHPGRLPHEPPYLLAANHSSHLDTPAVLTAVRRARGREHARTIHVLGARDYFFDTPAKRWFFSTFLNVVPIEREESSLAGLRLVRSIVEEGESVLIFPEGTRSRSGEIQPFKPGLGLIAWELAMPVVPVHVAGTHEAMPPGRSVPHRHPVRVTFAEPMAPERWSEEAERRPRDELYRRIADDVRDRILELSDGRPAVASRSA
ncbi:MAG: AMP-binding protein [Gemmatimonadota bacterium]|nr:AMP-binding protein [Gemmatimonadota bacterium]